MTDETPPRPAPVAGEVGLRDLARLDGFLAASLVDPLTGSVLDAVNTPGETGVSVTAAGAAELMHTLTVMNGRLAADSDVEDVVVTTGAHTHVVRTVEPAPGETALLVVTLTRTRARLAVALREIRDAGVVRAP